MDGDGEGDTGGDTELPNDNGWQPNDTNTLWGWLDNIVSGFVSLIENIQNLPLLIWNFIKGGFESVVSVITDIPNLIKGILTDIFVPDDNYITNSFNSFLEELKFKFNLDTGFFESLFESEQPIEDVYIDYTIPYVGDFHLKVFDAKFLADGVEYFRPFIRGFLVLLMFLFHVKQLIGFFGYDAGVVAGRSDSIKEARAEQRKE